MAFTSRYVVSVRTRWNARSNEYRVRARVQLNTSGNVTYETHVFRSAVWADVATWLGTII